MIRKRPLLSLEN